MSLKVAHNKSAYWKIIIAFLLGCFTILFALGINKTTFRQMLNTVKQISEPDPKLNLVNDIFRKVVTLDQLQRQQAIETKHTSYNPFLEESQRIQHMLDTLAAMSTTDTAQLTRIDSMKQILYERDNLFVNYIYLRNKFHKNDTLNLKIQALSNLIASSPLSTDSNIVKTEKKVTTTTIEHKDTTNNNDRSSFWDRLFGKRRTDNPRQIEKLIKEELKVNIDTTAIGKEDSVIRVLDSIITYQETSRIKRHNILTDQQTELNRESNVLISQLMTILRDIETEENRKLESKNVVATYIVDTDLRKMDAILVVFILCTAILIYLIIIDVARSNRYRKQLMAAKEEAEQLGLVKQRFLANMSHELRTPLQTIIGVAEQARGNNGDDDTLEIIYQSSLHLLQIVNEVLDYSRIVSGKFQLDEKPFSMYQLLNEVADILKIQAELKHIVFRYSFNVPEHAFYKGDAFRLKQILYNLLGNAIKFTEQGSVQLQVKRYENGDGDKFIFSVKDTGMGIATEELEKIFNQFEQGTSSQQKAGAGLGLNIVKELVAVQNGAITVTSKLGSGSEFNVSLIYPKAVMPGILPIRHIDVKNRNSKIWIVDDDTFILQLCAGIFEKYNIPYRYFDSATNALTAKWEEDIALVLLDIRMPDMNGMELCRKLKEKNGTTDVSYVALTAQAMPDEQDSILKSGFDGLLMKPFMEQDLINVINQYANVRTQSQIRAHSFDMAAVSLMTGEDSDLIKKSLQTFIDETIKDIIQLKQFILDNSYSQYTDCLHRLASRCGQVGARKLSLHIRETELYIRHHQKWPEDKNWAITLYDKLYMLIDEMKIGLQ